MRGLINKMDEKDFNIDDIINDVNSKKLANESKPEMENDISFNDNTETENKVSDQETEQTDENISDTEETEKSTEDIHLNDEDNQDVSSGAEPIIEPENNKKENIYLKTSDAVQKKNIHKKKKRKKNKQVNTSIFSGLIIVILILTVSLVVAIGGISLGMEYTGMGKSENEITFNIPKNSSTDDIAQILADNQIGRAHV